MPGDAREVLLCPEDDLVNETIVSSLPEDYQMRTILHLCNVITACKKRYNEYAIRQAKRMLSCPDYDKLYELLKGLGQDKHNELHDLIDKGIFAALVFQLSPGTKKGRKSVGLFLLSLNLCSRESPGAQGKLILAFPSLHSQMIIDL